MAQSKASTAPSFHAQVLHACTKMQPQPYNDDALLTALCSAATRRWALCRQATLCCTRTCQIVKWMY